MASVHQAGEIRRIQKDLAALYDDAGEVNDIDRALTLLSQLAAHGMTVDLLRITKIGKTVSRLRKACKDEQVDRSARMLIGTWKKVANQESGSRQDKDREPPQRTPEHAAKRAKPSPPSSSQSPTPHPVAKTAPATSSRTQHTDKERPKGGAASQSGGTAKAVEFSCTGDKVRDSCRKLLAQALHKDGTDLAGANAGRLAERIEEELFKLHGSTCDKYKNAVRSRRSNLADPKNNLRLSVLSGAVSPQRLAVMTPMDMANSEILAQIEEAHKANLHDAQVGGATTTQTDMFKCGKCKKQNCSYFQMQTRSADEPMTTFVTCNVCGNKWKFS